MKQHSLWRGAFRALLLLCLVGSTASVRADIIRGRIIDSESQECLPFAEVEFSIFTGNAYIVMQECSDSLGRVLFHAFRGSWDMEVKMLGYESRKQRVMSLSDERTDTIDLGDIALKMSAEMLKLVEIKGRARRFTMRGDTIVFHPEAFHLEENARLDELLRQLPGIEAGEDGSLRWNGKPIRVTMDGESLFSGDALIGQLPARAVQDIKAYNKASEFSQRTGRDDGREDMVLDLSIKPGFLDRWYGDATVGGQTQQHYQTDLTLNRLSKTDPVMLFANANNTNVMRRRQMGGGSSNWSGGNGQEQGAAAGYEHRRRRQAGQEQLLSKYNFSGGVAHDDQWRTTTQETLNFLPDASATRQSSINYGRTHLLNPYFDTEWLWRKDSLNTFTFEIQAEHKRKRDLQRIDDEQSESSASSPSIYAATLLQQSRTEGSGRTATLYGRSSWEHYVKDGALGASAEFDFEDGNSETYTTRNIERVISESGHAAVKGEKSESIRQHAFSPLNSLKLKAEAHFQHWVTKQWLLDLSYWLNYERRRTHQDFETNGTTDAANSFRDHQRLLSNTLYLSSAINVHALQFHPGLSARWTDERQDYQRGRLDTTAVRRRLLFTPSFTTKWKVSKADLVELHYEFASSRPSLLQTLAYRDQTHPLFITEGNPALKDSHTHKFSLNYSTMVAQHQLSLSASVNYQWSDREQRTDLRYNPFSGVYRSRPVNVHGGRSLSVHLNYDQGFGHLFRLQNSFRLTTERCHALLLAYGDALPRLSAQSVLHPVERLTFSLDTGKWKASLFGLIDATRNHFSATPEQNTTLWHNEVGMTAELTLGHFVFRTRLTQQMNHGYTVAAMNRNLLVWDASVTWKILRGKANLSLDFDDLLNRKDNRWSSQSANQQTTKWNDNRHHYAALTFTCRLDAKVKGEK